MKRIAAVRRALVLAGAAAAVLPAVAVASSDGPQVVEARTVHPTIFQYGMYGVGYRLTVAAATREVSLTLRLYRGAPDGEPIHTWRLGQIPSGRRTALNWHGVLPSGWALQGPYTIEARATDGRGRSLAADSVKRSRERVRFYRHRFPLRGRHDYGSHAASFGAGRGGRSHQGHDVFARAGTAITAVHAGRVVWRRYQAGGAGHYVVIRGRDGRDQVYMHLAEAAEVEEGRYVRTGQKIGRVGCTGRCSGPHLHFELWTPRWFDGGSAFDPLPELRRWDRWS